MFFSLDLFLALLLIMVPELLPPEQPTRGQCQDLQQAAYVLELAEPRENWCFYCCNTRDFLESSEGLRIGYMAELEILRSRWQRLKYAPSLTDHCRWEMAYAVSKEMREFGHQRCLYLTGQRDGGLCPRSLEAELEETRELVKVWEEVQVIGNSQYGVVARRESLKRLRHMIGDDDYCAGILPPPIPIWRYRWID